MPDSERTFTLTELRRYDGDGVPMYIAAGGVVYEVTDCPRWRSGLHEHLHFPGQDLSDEITNAPHKWEVFERPCVRRIGLLVD